MRYAWGGIVRRPAVSWAMLFCTVLSVSVAYTAAFGRESAVPSGPLRLVVDETGGYSVQQTEFGWSLKGRVPVRTVRRFDGNDRLGNYTEYQLAWNPPSKLTGRIRIYPSAQLILFAIATPEAVAKLPPFPSFHQIPDALHIMSYREAPFAPHAWSGEQNGTPWMIFDDAGNTCVLSAASDFLVSRMWGDGRHEIASGLNWQLSQLPAGFEHSSIMVFGRGVVPTVRAWGHALTTLSGRTLEASDSEPLLKYLGYWTDNGSHYYYQFDKDKGYAGTLETLRDDWRKRGIPLRYLQLDSWWYPKAGLVKEKRDGSKVVDPDTFGWNGIGGTWVYNAAPELFPDGLSAFQKAIDLPLIAHGRGVDPKSPYAQTYQLAGEAPIDHAYWEAAARRLFDSGVVCYEQDWLSEIYKDSAPLSSTIEAGTQFTTEMSTAMAEYGLTLQYSMALPRFFLDASRISNVTTIRASTDRFERRKWDDFIYAALLARACGAWPWADVCRSTEPDNLLIETLSAGPVGIGDEMGAENVENLRRVVRTDGVIVKPDETLVPTEESLAGDAVLAHEPLVAWTYTDHPARTAYVVAFTRKHDSEAFRFVPEWFGLSGQVFVYDYFAGSGQLIGASDAYSSNLSDADRMYFVVAPLGSSGIALVGDRGKYVTSGRQRIPKVVDADGHVSIIVELAQGESSVTLMGYAAAAPKVVSIDGTNDPVSYDAATKLFSVTVHPKDMGGDSLIRNVNLVLDGHAPTEPAKSAKPSTAPAPLPAHPPFVTPVPAPGTPAPGKTG